MNRIESFPSDPSAAAVAQAAAVWVLRLDRGLTPAEQDAYTQWLAADPRHRAALAEHRWGWDELDRLAGLQSSAHALPDPDLLRPPVPRRALRFWPQALGLAAALALAAVILWPRADPTVTLPPLHVPAPSYALAAPIEQRTLEDGSVVALNRGAVLETHYGDGFRRVTLRRGEATFTVAKDASRPFIVHANGVDVRAVGTAFNVRLDAKGVEVLVTEGRVAVRTDSGPVAAGVSGGEQQPAPAAEVHLTAGQRTIVAAHTADAPPVFVVTEEEIARALAWQPRLLDFTDAPMSAIVAEFNRRNPVRLVPADAAVEQLRLSASFRSDNVEGFVRLMESDFGLRAEWRGETEIVLRRR